MKYNNKQGESQNPNVCKISARNSFTLLCFKKVNNALLKKRSLKDCCPNYLNLIT